MSTDQLLNEIRALEIKVEAQSRRLRAMEQRRARVEHLERQLDRLEEAQLKLEKRKLQMELDGEHGLADDDEVEAVGTRIALVDEKMTVLRHEIESLRTGLADDEVSTLKMQLRHKLADAILALRGDGRTSEMARLEHRLEELSSERRTMLTRSIDLLLESRNHLVRAAAELEAIEQGVVKPANGGDGDRSAVVARGPRQRAALLVRAAARAFREAWDALVEVAAAWEDAHVMARERDWLAVPFEDVGRRIEPSASSSPSADAVEAAEGETSDAWREASRDLRAVTLWVSELRARVAALDVA